MLKTNLATRPFYNERAVQFVLGVLAVLVLAISAFNAFELIRLTDSQRTLGAHAVDAEREAARLRSEAATIRGQINAKELEVVANAAREANSIITAMIGTAITPFSTADQNSSLTGSIGVKHRITPPTIAAEITP